MRSRILALVLSGCAFALAPAAAALPSPPATKVSKKDDRRARKLYKKGDRAYAEGRYEDAVAAFEEAYSLSGRSLLLYNLGNAYERLGRYQDAAEALERYLPDSKKGEHDVIAKRIENLKRRATREQEKKEREEQAAKKEQKKAQPKPAKKPEHKQDEGGGSSATLGYVLLGTGGGAIVLGGVFGALALGARHDEKSGCANGAGGRYCTTSAESAIDRDKRYSLFADIGFGVGVVAAGVGTYLLLTPEKAKKEHSGQANGHFSSALGASPRPGGGELDFVGRF